MSSVASPAEAAMREIDAYAEPGKMSQEEALAFYEAIAADVEARIDGLKTDLRDAA